MARRVAPSRPAPTRQTATSGLGGRLRQARQARGVTVRGLARIIGVSPSLVSQVECGHIMPSVATLYAIANQLELVVDDLFRDSAQTVNPRHRRTDSDTPVNPVQRGQRRPTIRLAEGVRWERLTPTPDPEIEFLYVVYEVGAESCDEQSLIRHGGTEYAYVIGGRLGVRIGFEEYELGVGDAITFDAQTPHRLWTIGKKPAEAIWVMHNRHSDQRPSRSRPTVPRNARALVGNGH
jgi:transcriptional regulator with XRE-family HTH domain